MSATPARGPSTSRAKPILSITTAAATSISAQRRPNGAYNLSGGALSVPTEYIGSSGVGTLSQSGGTNTVSGTLYLGYNAGASGTYNLSGTGQLTAPTEYVGYASTAAATFQQTGGTNTTSTFNVGAGGQYVLAGGTLQVGSGSLINQGIFSGGTNPASPATFDANCLVDMTSGTWKNLGDLSVNMAANSLLIVPAGFNPATGFASYSSLGLTHVAGTTLTVPAGMGFGGIGSINDPVVCQGTITASSNGTINLDNGLMLSGNGNINLGNAGSLTVNNAVSGISGGSLNATNQYVGKGGTGSFAHSGGTNAYSDLYLGYNTGDSGTYTLSGTGSLAGSSYYAGTEYIGYSGTGVFTQTGGSNTSSGYYGTVYLGYNTGASGTYALSGTGVMSTAAQYVGYSGTGVFTQTGGSNSNSGMTLGDNATGNGTYSIASGALAVHPVRHGRLQRRGRLQPIGWNRHNLQRFVRYGLQLHRQRHVQHERRHAVRGDRTRGRCRQGRLQSVGRQQYHLRPFYVGYNGGNGTYNLSGAGALSAAQEYVGYTSTATAVFQQSGGMNTATTLTIGAGGQYLLTGGTLPGQRRTGQPGPLQRRQQPRQFCHARRRRRVGSHRGPLAEPGRDLAEHGGQLVAGHAGRINPATAFGSYSSQGLVYTPGTTLTVPAGKGFAGTYSFNDPVVCQGTITAADGLINLNNGLTRVSGNAVVSLGGGNLKSSVTVSGNASINPRQRQRRQRQPHGQRQHFQHQRRPAFQLQHVPGLQRHVQLRQTGGTNTASDNFYLGYNTGNVGTYTLSGGLLSAPTGYYSNATGSEYVGYSGTGTITQSGGTNAVTSYLALGYNSGAKGTYNMLAGTAGPYLIAPGFYGTRLNQSGGTVGAGFVEVAYAASTASGTYTLTRAACKRARRTSATPAPGPLLSSAEPIRSTAMFLSPTIT